MKTVVDRLRRIVVAALLAILACAPAGACLWDRDTLSAEAIGLPEVIDVIIGRFERPPAKFYEMRLARVSAQLRNEPDNWAAYDDAGVASDRLHRGDEAIEWMVRKKASLDRAPANDATASEHLYRYHANIGTFYAHRWVRGGAPRDRLGDLATAREHIAAAIGINPQAHFGRERYQLMAIEWLLAGPNAVLDPRASSLFWAARDPLGSDPLGEKNAHRLAAAGFGDAVQGLSGLIVLGDAWQSADIYHALGLALNDAGHGAAAYLAAMRMNTLIHASAEKDRSWSLLPGNDDRLLSAQDRIRKGNRFLRVHEYYEPAARAAQHWHEHRRAFMLGQLDAGRHPDTHPDFWKDYRELPVPKLESDRQPAAWGPVLALLLLLPILAQVVARIRSPKIAAADGVVATAATAIDWLWVLVLPVVIVSSVVVVGAANAFPLLFISFFVAGLLVAFWIWTGDLLRRPRGRWQRWMNHFAYALSLAVFLIGGTAASNGAKKGVPAAAAPAAAKAAR